MNVLFVCSQNCMRSLTAALLYFFTPGIITRSAGVDYDLKKEDLDWADHVIVMEKTYRNKIHSQWPDIYAKKKITCLYIRDIYSFCQPELITILKNKTSKWLGLPQVPENWEELVAKKIQA